MVVDHKRFVTTKVDLLIDCYDEKCPFLQCSFPNCGLLKELHAHNLCICAYNGNSEHCQSRECELCQRLFGHWKGCRREGCALCGPVRLWCRGLPADANQTSVQPMEPPFDIGVPLETVRIEPSSSCTKDTKMNMKKKENDDNYNKSLEEFAAFAQENQIFEPSEDTKAVEIPKMTATPATIHPDWKQKQDSLNVKSKQLAAKKLDKSTQTQPTVPSSSSQQNKAAPFANLKAKTCNLQLAKPAPSPHQQSAAKAAVGNTTQPAPAVEKLNEDRLVNVTFEQLAAMKGDKGTQLTQLTGDKQTPVPKIQICVGENDGTVYANGLLPGQKFVRSADDSLQIYGMLPGQVVCQIVNLTPLELKNPLQQTAAEKVKFFRTPDGSLHMNGLLPGQGLFKLPNGKYQIGTEKELKVLPGGKFHVPQVTQPKNVVQTKQQQVKPEKTVVHKPPSSCQADKHHEKGDSWVGPCGLTPNSVGCGQKACFGCKYNIDDRCIAKSNAVPIIRRSLHSAAGEQPRGSMKTKYSALLAADLCRDLTLSFD